MDRTDQPTLRYPGPGLALLAAAQFIIAADYNIVYVALPSIGSALGFSPRGLQWVVSAYALAFGGFLLLGGRLGDLIGRRRAFVVALLLYALASLVGGFATVPAALVISRAVQGLGGALLFPTTLALISTYFAEGSARNRALAVVGAAGASGGALGALLGGLITSSLGWSWTFFVNVPIAGLAGIAALWLLPKDEPVKTRGPIDVPGAFLITGGATMLVLSCIEGPQLGWLTPSVLGLFAASAAMISAFHFIEARTAAPLMPPRLLHHPTLSPAILITGLFGAAFGAQYFLLTTYLQEVRHHAPSVAGLSFLPFALAIVAGTRISGRLVAAVGLRNGLLLSLAVGIAGQTVVALSLSAEGSYVTHVLPGFLLDGVGQGATWTLMWIAATPGIDAKDRGIASGMASSAQQIGAALGLALLVGVASSFLQGGADAGGLLAGLHAAFFTAAGISMLAGLVAFMKVTRAPQVQLSIAKPVSKIA